MQSPFVKRVIALVAGLIVSMGLILLVERLGHSVFPPPAALTPDATTMTDPAAQAALMKAVADYIATAPLGALLFPVLAWGVGAAGGAWIAARLAPATQGLRSAAIIGAVVMLGTVMNLRSIPHPVWMWLAGPLVVLAGTWLGARLGGALGGVAPVAAD
ncbi:MAG: hypothetical protein IPJ58_17355 [Ardenticatenia bacterium]|nr:hypothetical protein [Ardenticatenia bacterium]